MASLGYNVLGPVCTLKEKNIRKRRKKKWTDYHKLPVINIEWTPRVYFLSWYYQGLSQSDEKLHMKHAFFIGQDLVQSCQKGCKNGNTHLQNFRMKCLSLTTSGVNTHRPRQNGCHFLDDIFKCIFLNENVLISIKISLKFVPVVWINNIPVLVQIMAWHPTGRQAIIWTNEGKFTDICMHHSASIS